MATSASAFSIALRSRLEDMSFRQDAEDDVEAKRASFASRMRLHALDVTRRMDEEEQAVTVDRRGRLRRMKRGKRPTVVAPFVEAEHGQTMQWSRMLLIDGQPIGYVLAPAGAVHFDRRPPRPHPPGQGDDFRRYDGEGDG